MRSSLPIFPGIAYISAYGSDGEHIHVFNQMTGSQQYLGLYTIVKYWTRQQVYRRLCEMFPNAVPWVDVVQPNVLYGEIIEQKEVVRVPPYTSSNQEAKIEAETSGREWGDALKAVFGVSDHASNGAVMQLGRKLSQLVYGQDVSIDVAFAFIKGFNMAFDAKAAMVRLEAELRHSDGG
jgi:hypothetical protein